MHDDIVGGAAVTAAKTMTYGGSASAIIFGLSSGDITAFAGVLIAMAGLVLQWWFKRRQLAIIASYYARAEARPDQSVDI